VDDLRRLTVKVLLALLVFLVVGDLLDDLIFDNHVASPIQFYILIGGMVTGLFTPEIVRRTKEDDREKSEEPDPKEVGIGHL
jgi:hypothetical protein